VRTRQTAVLRFRAVFGLGFLLLGLVMLWRVALAGAPAQNKLIGLAFALVMIGLGVVRIRDYARARRGGGP
jgi:hypothetical protein